jgi:xylulokinase
MIEEQLGREGLLHLVANVPMPGFTAPSLLWVRDHEPEVWKQVRRVMLPKDYVRWRAVGGESVTDVSDASGTLLFDVRQRRWSTSIIDRLGLEPSWLPEAVEAVERVGWTPGGTPVAAGAGDQAAAALGMGLQPDGAIGVSLGTSGVLAKLRSTPPTADTDGRLQELCGYSAGTWQTMGVTLSAGGSLAWWQRCCREADLQILLGEAAGWPPGCDGLTFLPYLSGERAPHLDEEIRGSFTGLAAHHDRGAMTRAVVEGVACSLSDVLALLQPGHLEHPARLTGGLARSPLISEILSSTLGCVLEHTVVDEGAAYGAALLAGVAAGVLEDVAEVSELPRVAKRTEPDASLEDTYRQLRERFRNLYPRADWTGRSICATQRPGPGQSDQNDDPTRTDLTRRHEG